MSKIKTFEAFGDFFKRKKTSGDKIKDILTKEGDELKLNQTQKERIKESGLSTNYRAFGAHLQFTKIGQRSGSEIAHISSNGKYHIYMFLSKTPMQFDTLDEAIDAVIRYHDNPREYWNN
jgi:hypothetical protein